MSSCEVGEADWDHCALAAAQGGHRYFYFHDLRIVARLRIKAEGEPYERDES
jgi:hypothetical protein